MSRTVHFAIPGNIETRSGGYGYDRRMIAEMTRLGWRVERLALRGSFPQPGKQDLAATSDAFAALPDGALVLVDGLAFGAMPELAAREAERLRLVALVHHPLSLEEGLPRETSQKLAVSERASLVHARQVVVTSPATARTLREDFGVSGERLTVVLPGTDPAPQAVGGGAEPLILSVGTLIPRKDHATLVTALAMIADIPWRCRIVGGDTADRATAEALRAQITDAGLPERIALLGTLDDVSPEYARADIFALASRYEGFGMVFAEAMARGLPIVACAGGAVPEVVPPDAGILVPPGDAAGFAKALRRLLEDVAKRQAMAEASRRAGAALPGWEESAAVLSGVLGRTVR